MNIYKYIVWCFAWITILIGVISILIIKHIEYQVISTPVEEMYHRQLVITIDSIFDARFGNSCCEEVIDSVDANTFRTRFGGNLSPMD